MSTTASTKLPTRKVTAGALGSGAVGVPLATLLAWALAQNGVEMPPEVVAAMAGLLTTVFGFVGAYLTPEAG